MSGPDFSALAALPTKRVPAAWQPPIIVRPKIPYILAFDQSLRATGWVLLAWLGQPTVVDAGTIRTRDTKERGHEQNLLWGIEVYKKAGAIMDSCAIYLALQVAHETPPAGSKMSRPESSLLSALSIRIAAQERHLDMAMVGAQTGKKLVCGNGNADKIVAHEALRVHVAPQIRNYDKITNEATRDALMVALAQWSKEPYQ